MNRKEVFVKAALGISLILLLFLAGCAKSVDKISNAASEGQSVSEAAVGNRKGFRAPDFTVTTTDGNTFTLSEVTAEGKPVVVYFMATWCPYCTRDLAAVKRVYPEYKDQVEFIAIDLDLTESSRVLSQYKTRANHEILLAPGNPQVLTDYGIRATTTKFAVSRGGIILYSGSGVLTDSQWETIFGGLALP